MVRFHLDGRRLEFVPGRRHLGCRQFGPGGRADGPVHADPLDLLKRVHRVQRAVAEDAVHRPHVIVQGDQAFLETGHRRAARAGPERGLRRRDGDRRDR
jgi:hypothetical protein